MIILEENFKRHLEAFASELFIYTFDRWTHCLKLLDYRHTRIVHECNQIHTHSFLALLVSDCPEDVPDSFCKCLSFCRSLHIGPAEEQRSKIWMTWTSIQLQRGYAKNMSHIMSDQRTFLCHWVKKQQHKNKKNVTFIFFRTVILNFLYF